MTQDIVFDDLETPCWRPRGTEMELDILEKRAKQPWLGQSPTSLPGDSARRKSPGGDSTSKYSFGTALGILGEKPVSQILDEHQNPD